MGTETLKRLNVACRRNLIAGSIGVESFPLPSANIVADLKRCASSPLRLEDNFVGEILFSHVLEHIRNVLPMMEELHHRRTTVDAIPTIRVPCGSGDDAFEDPTDVRQISVGSFGCFSQPYYWRADCGYRGDWITDSVTLETTPPLCHPPDAELWERMRREQNVITEMVDTLHAVKPIRQPLRELRHAPSITSLR